MTQTLLLVCVLSLLSVVQGMRKLCNNDADCPSTFKCYLGSAFSVGTCVCRYDRESSYYYLCLYVQFSQSNDTVAQGDVDNSLLTYYGHIYAGLGILVLIVTCVIIASCLVQKRRRFKRLMEEASNVTWEPSPSRTASPRPYPMDYEKTANQRHPPYRPPYSQPQRPSVTYHDYASERQISTPRRENAGSVVRTDRLLDYDELSK